MTNAELREAPRGDIRSVPLSAVTQRGLLYKPAYYNVLMGETDFRDALTQLFSDLHTNRRRRYPSARQRSAMERFVETWKLPRQDGAEDLWSSYQWHSSIHRLLLLPAAWAEFLPSRDIQIKPYQPAPFEYDPLARPHSWVKDRADAEAKRVREGILKQAETIEKQVAAVGWRKPAPRARSRDLDKGARRYYLRAVKRRSYGAIRLETKASSTGQIHGQVADWQKRFGWTESSARR